jgi:hypothetical protein
VHLHRTGGCHESDQARLKVCPECIRPWIGVETKVFFGPIPRCSSYNPVVVNNSSNSSNFESTAHSLVMMNLKVIVSL